MTPWTFDLAVTCQRCGHAGEVRWWMHDDLLARQWAVGCRGCGAESAPLTPGAGPTAVRLP